VLGFLMTLPGLGLEIAEVVVRIMGNDPSDMESRKDLR
jgi:hypothetical protein